MENKINCLIILGMYRSGTSTLTGCFNLLGVNPGKNFIPPDQSNENRYFGNNDLVLIHDILLRDLGCKWDMVGNLPRDWQESEAANRARQSIKSILERNFSSNKIWVVNDPRMCRFMPLWLPLLEEMRANPGLILNLRHPLETAQSLAQKDGFDLQKSFLLWLSHYREAFSACWNNSNVVITYDQLLADPVSTLKFISESLNIDYPRPLQNTYPEILDFVRPEMKHQHSGQSQNKEESGFAHFIHLYNQILQLCVERTTLLTAEAGKETGVSRYNKELLPSVLQHLSSENSVSGIQDSKREKAVLASGRLFNDILSLVGDHERAQHSLHLEKEHRLINSTKLGTALFAQVYFPQEHGALFTEEKSKKILLAPVEWQKITVMMPDPILVKNKGLCLKPLNTRGIVHISSIRLVNSATEEVVFKIEKPEEFEKCQIREHAFPLPGQEGLTLFVFNHDPQIIHPPILDLPDCPLEIRIWIKAQTDQKEIKNLWIQEQEYRKELETKLAESEEQLSASRSQMDAEQESSASRSQMDAEQESRKGLELLKAELETKLAESEEQLSASRLQTQKEQDRINQLNLENSRLSTRNYLYAEKNKQLKRWMDQLHNDFNALVGSKRWRTGNALIRFMEVMLLKGKKPGAAHHMQQVFASYNSMQKNERTKSSFHQSWNLNKKVSFDRLMQQLENDVSAMCDSTRWKTGNTVIRIFEIMLLRGKPRLAMNHMQKIFSEYQIKKDQGQSITLGLMQKWMRQLEVDFQNTLVSRRWRVGKSLVRGLEMLLLRKKKPMAPDHMQTLFDQFRQGQYTHHFNDSNELTVQNYPSQFNTYVSPEQAAGKPYTLRPPV
ncbi:MAG: hypothetical protein HF982_09850 [Desulfobacteraceae bacterium]|nr:hypothetical protein [Desulfobacteraceae bacterium]MBC2719869.1 hypothetical protein [Desulfobacteraceae bacterium]